MPKLRIVRLGHPALRTKSKTVSKKVLVTKSFQQFLDDLAQTCLKNNGAGIAAPQVGVNQRVIVVHVEPDNPRYPNQKPFPLTIVINPKIAKQSKKHKEDWEGDLSASLRALVPRPIHCTVVGLDRYGKRRVYELTNKFHARVFQHEIDHLDGIFFLDRVKKEKTISELAEWVRYWKKG